MKFIDDNYLKFYDLTLLSGSNIKPVYLNDSTFHALVSRALAASLNWTPDEALGQTLSVGGQEHHYKIVGVVEDFNVSSAHDAIKPAILAYNPKEMYKISLKLPDEQLDRYLEKLTATYRSFFPTDLFEYQLLSQSINQRYAVEHSLQKALRFVAILAILLGAIGLYGLVSFMANQHAKVIGIRKVFGASVTHIMTMFTKEYVVLLLLSFFISAPVSYYVMDEWVSSFANRIEVGSLYFLTGFLLTLVIAALTVGYRSYKASVVNPIQSLRHE